MTDKQPEALRLAEILEAGSHQFNEEAADELRRLHALNQEMLNALRGLLSITLESSGVAGYHLNGDTADWDTFPEVGKAYEAVAQAEGEAQ